VKYKITHILFIISLINFNTAHAFFLINDHPGEIRIDHTIIDSSTQDNNVFQLYDNFFDYNSSGFLVKKVDGFIPVDQVKLNIPLKILARSSIYSENSIDRILLANLRIKNIVSEYRKLQEDTRFRLQTHKIKGWQKKSNSLKFEDDNMDNIESENEIIRKKIFNINRLTRISLEADPFDKRVLINESSDSKNETKPLVKAISDTSIFFTEKGNDPELLQKNHNTGRQMPISIKDDELPWVFNFVLKIIDYVLNNRVEFILYMSFAAVIVFFISLQMKR